MAYIDVDAILARCREVLESSVTILHRNITDATFEGFYSPELPRAERSRLGLVNTRYDVREVGMSPNAASPASLSPISFWDIQINVTVSRHFNAAHVLADAVRDGVEALATQDGDVIAQAFGVPYSLAYKADGTATNLLSGILRFEGSERGDYSLGAGDGVIETVHKFAGIVSVDRSA